MTGCSSRYEPRLFRGLTIDAGYSSLNRTIAYDFASTPTVSQVKTSIGLTTAAPEQVHRYGNHAGDSQHDRDAERQIRRRPHAAGYDVCHNFAVVSSVWRSLRHRGSRDYYSGL